MSLLVRRKNNNLTTDQNRLSLMNDFDRFFDETFNRMGLADLSSQKDWQPSVNVSETDKEYKVMVEVPGMEEKDIDLTLQDNTLYIKGEKKFEKEESGENFHRVESSYGAFSRSIPFAASINENKVNAGYKDGILQINLGKSDEVVKSTHKIKIKKH